MKGFLKASAIVVMMCGAFAWCGEILTDVSSTGGGSVGGEVGAAQGESLFFAKGKCFTCHAVGGRGSAVRCPNLGVSGDKYRQPIAVRAQDQVKGTGDSVMKYIVESMYDPNAIITTGFPKGLMPPVHRPPISLNEEEIASIILYLFALSDVEPDEKMLAEMRTLQKRYSVLGGAADPVPAVVGMPGGDAENGYIAYVRNGCWKCHEIKGIKIETDEPLPPGSVGPELTTIGAIQTREYLIETILDPNAVIVADPPKVIPRSKKSYLGENGGSRMPSYLAAMTIQDMLDIAAFTKALSDEKINAELVDGIDITDALKEIKSTTDAGVAP